MDIPSRYSPRERGGPPPAIYIEETSRFDRSGRFGHPRPHASNFSPSSIPMSIPNNRRIAEDDAPPPLPPPRFLPGIAPGPPVHDRVPSIDSNASWDSVRRDSENDHMRFRKQEFGRPHQRDEGYHSMNSTLSSIRYVIQCFGGFCSQEYCAVITDFWALQFSRFSPEEAFHVSQSISVQQVCGERL